MRSVIGICATCGTLVGGYLPTLWGASNLSLQSLLLAVIGGAGGVWFGARLSDA